jgi:transposase
MSTEVNMNNQTKQKQPNYTIEFKQDAAKLVNDKDYIYTQITTSCGRGTQRLCL